MIEIRDVTFRYAGAEKPSLRSFDLTVKRGEFVLLCGRSGCGKTTATRLINGLIPRFYGGELSGCVRLDGRDISDLSPGEISSRVGSVFQDPRSQFFTTDTTSEIAFACENEGTPRNELLDRIALSSCEFDIVDLLDRSIFELSSGEKQRVAVASAHASRPAVYVLDEPSANLDPVATEQLAGVLRKLKGQGATIVVSEHRLSYLRDLVDRVVVIEDGEKAYEMTPAEMRSISMADAAKRGLRAVFPERVSVGEPAYSLPGDAPLFEVGNLSFSYGRAARVLDDVGFTARSGEVIGLVGENGAGKSTLASVLCGLRKPTAGSICFDGRRMSARSLRRMASFVMQDADYQLFAESVHDELLLGMGDAADAGARAEQAIEQLGLSGLEDRHPASLSGGQKQRVTIGAAMVRDSKLVFFDEPTSGLDGGSMRCVAAMIADLGRAGCVAFVITHDYELACACCTRVLRIDEGRVASDVPVDPAHAAVLREMFGMSSVDSVA